MPSLGLMENVKEAVHRVQVTVTGKAWMADREVLARKQLFGIEFFDLLLTDKKACMDLLLYQVDVSGAECFMQCKEVILQLEAEHTSRLKNLHLHKETVNKKASDLVVIAKLQQELASLEHKMRSRKEQFGVEVFDSVSTTTTATRKSKAVGSRSLQKCIRKAKLDVWELRTQDKDLIEI